MLKKFSYLLGLLIVSALLTELLLYSQNTLLNNDQWRSTKRSLNLGLVGSDEFIIDRSVLAMNRLDLSKYFDFQEIYTKDELSATSISFDLLVPEESYLDFSIGQINQLQYGIRFNKQPSKNSFFFIKKSDGEFIEKRDFSVTADLTAWNRVDILKSGEEVALKFNSGEKLQLPIAVPMVGRVAFKGGGKGALLDSIEIEQENGDVFYESFRNTTDWLKVVFIHFVLILLSIEGLHLFLKLIDRKKYNFRNFIVYQFAICLLILFIGDYFFWSLRPYSTQSRLLFSDQSVSTPALEMARFTLFKEWAEAVGVYKDPKIEIDSRGYPSERIWKGPILCTSNPLLCSHTSVVPQNSQCKRLLFLGSSQTIGAGASDLDKTFFVRTHHNLAGRGFTECLVSLNLSISGAKAAEVAENFESNFLDFKPDLVIVNLSSNDDYLSLRTGLTKLLDLNQKYGFKTIFLEEANSSIANKDEKGIVAKHGIMRDVAAKYAVPTLHLHEMIKANQNSELGVLWWDFVHYTDYGHRIVADWLTDKLMDSSF
tara:strand:- start:5490 stop:7109 length:1620 start_codon:yes stop_codon:yes gene_type:complete